MKKWKNAENYLGKIIINSVDSYGVFVGFHQIRDLKCNEAVLNIAVLPCNCAVKGCSVRGKSKCLLSKFPKHCCVGN